MIENFALCFFIFYFWEFDRIGVYRDAYGFAVRPQHVQRYREYANIYKVWFYLLWSFLLVLSLNTLVWLLRKFVKKEEKRIIEFIIYIFLIF